MIFILSMDECYRVAFSQRYGRLLTLLSIYPGRMQGDRNFWTAAGFHFFECLLAMCGSNVLVKQSDWLERVNEESILSNFAQIVLET